MAVFMLLSVVIYLLFISDACLLSIWCNMTGAKEVEEYSFTNTEVSNQTFEDGMVGICVKLSFKRNIFGAIMTIYIPSTLIVFVSYLTTIFNNKQWFGHIITINLTVMTITPYICYYLV